MDALPNGKRRFEPGSGSTSLTTSATSTQRCADGGKLYVTLLSVPWKCPACQSEIQHLPFQQQPLLNVRYRCAVCRLEAIVDPRTGRLEVAPLIEGEDPHERPTS